MQRFALIGAAGYVAPRHMRAMKETGNVLVALLDPYDGIGVVDEYFPDADFFTEPERFDRHLDKLRRDPLRRIDYVSICSPNYLHDAHIRMALRNGAHAICEKPLVLNPWNVDALERLEEEAGRNINVILQLRLHPAIIALKESIDKLPGGQIHDVELTYIAARGNWYHRSWKGSTEKSGGVATNIGIHFFDMLSWIFGKHESSILHHRDDETVAGISLLKNASVRWFLSVNRKFLPDQTRMEGRRTFRQIFVDGKRIEFSDGFTDLHTDSYVRILEGQGFGPGDARESIGMVYEMRNKALSVRTPDAHPLLFKMKNI